jgi:hypothetical protein
MSGKWHLGDTLATFSTEHGSSCVMNFPARDAEFYCYDDPTLYQFFPCDHRRFVEMYNKVVND